MLHTYTIIPPHYIAMDSKRLKEQTLTKTYAVEPRALAHSAQEVVIQVQHGIQQLRAIQHHLA